MKLPYNEGDWFAIPLSSGGYAVGIVARATAKGKVLLGYFFGPRRRELPRLEELSALGPESAVLVRRFGDLQLFRREWPVLGRDTPWDRERWPMPKFANKDLLNGRLWQVEYADDDPAAFIGQEPVDPAGFALLPPDGGFRSYAIADQLDSLLHRPSS